MGNEHRIGEMFPIDIHAPSGIFQTSDGNVYLVCDAVGKRFAIALEHKVKKSFLKIELNQAAIDSGTWFGQGKFVLVDAIEEVVGRLGHLKVCENFLQIRTVSSDGEWCWQTVAHGSCLGTSACFKTWAVMVCGEIVFHHDGSQAYFDEEVDDMVFDLI